MRNLFAILHTENVVSKHLNRLVEDGERKFVKEIDRVVAINNEQ